RLPINRRTSGGASRAPLGGRGRGDLRLVQRTNLALAFPRHAEEALGQRDRLLLRLRLDDRVAADHFLRIRERPIGHGELVAGLADPESLRAVLEPAGGDQCAGPGHLLDQLPHLLHLALAGRRGGLLARPVDAHVSHCRLSLRYAFEAWRQRRAFEVTWERIRSSCFRISPLGSLGAKSSVSNTWRSSISVPPSNGARLSHSIASSFDFTCQSQKPAISSFVSLNGPSVTVRLVPSN